MTTGQHDEPTTYYERAYSIQEHETKDFYAQWAATYDEELVGGRGYAMPGRCAAAFDTHVVDRSAPVIDYSTEMLAEAEKTGAYRSLWSADLNEPLEISNGAYGAVALMGVFSFGHVYAAALDEFRRILAPGGQMIIGVNEVFVDEGSLVAKLDQMHADGLLDVHVREYGEHMPASQVNGWVYVAQRVDS